MILCMHLPTDAACIAASAEDPEQFAPIFDRYFVEVHGFLGRRVGRDAADELAGEVFTVAFQGRERFDPAADSARPWLYGIAVHLVARWYRSAARRHRAYERSLGAGLVESNRDGADGYSRAEDRIDARAEAGRPAGERRLSEPSLRLGTAVHGWQRGRRYRRVMRSEGARGTA